MSTILVTGAESGMGRATVQRHLVEGWNVLAMDVASGEGRDGVHVAVADVADRNAVDAAIAAYAATTGEGIDVVANVAGVYPPSSLATYTEDVYRRIFDTNVLGVLNVTAAALPYMSEGSSIINFASVDALAVSPGQLLYGASKAAVVMLTRATALELAPRRIRVNGIAPGWIDSAANRASGRMEAAAASIPLGRVGQPEEVAEWVWLLGGSGVSEYVTGMTVNISGGDFV